MPVHFSTRRRRHDGHLYYHAYVPADPLAMFGLEYGVSRERIAEVLDELIGRDEYRLIPDLTKEERFEKFGIRFRPILVGHHIYVLRLAHFFMLKAHGAALFD